MLSYQHAYHAGNLADVHKHALLAWTISYLTQKPKPLSYMETHAGRGLYDLSGAEALKTGEAAQGVARSEAWFDAGHDYSSILSDIRTLHGTTSYPGSPLIASHLLRAEDRIHLAELHPQEHQALRTNMARTGALLHHQDGFEMALSLAPPTPRRGMLLIDPSYEIKKDYGFLPGFIAKVHRAWNVGVIMLWYPLLASGAQAEMAATLQKAHPEALCHEVGFPPARPGHGMIGSGVFVINPPYGLAAEAARLAPYFAQL